MNDNPNEFGLTPRQMWAAHTVARRLADGAYDDIAVYRDAAVTPNTYWSLFDAFPPVTWHESAQWRRYAARAFDDLAEDIAAGHQPRPTCTAEEMSLHLIIRHASALQLDDDERFALIPAHPDDWDWESAFDNLFKDHDVIMLLDDEEPDGVVHLDPRDWFTPFKADQARDQSRGFRR